MRYWYGDVLASTNALFSIRQGIWRRVDADSGDGKGSGGEDVRPMSRSGCRSVDEPVRSLRSMGLVGC